MQAIKHSAFLRPISRSSSPGPSAPRQDPGYNDLVGPTPVQRTSSRGPLHRLSFAATKSRASSPARGPNNSTTAMSGTSTAVTLVQDGSYLEALSLKLSDGVSKALATPPPAANSIAADDTFNGRRAIPTGRGKALADLISSEINAAHDNPQLHRAIIRQLQRPMSVLLTNLSSLLMPCLASGGLNSAGPRVTASPAQLFALSIAGFAGELLKGISDIVPSTTISEGRGDGLLAIREGLEAIIGRVVNPLINTIKQDSLYVLDELEQTPVDSWVPLAKSAAAGIIRPANPNQGFHPAINNFYSRLTRHTRCLQRLSLIPGKTTDSALAGLIIGLIWRALVALAHRSAKEHSGKGSTTASPVVNAGKRKLTPPTTPRMALHFKSTVAGSRPPSPTLFSPSRAADTKAVYDILTTLPRPPAGNILACEAVDEAFTAIRSLSVLFDTLDAYTGIVEDVDLDVLTNELPTLISLAVILVAPNVGKQSISGTVSQLLGMEETEYRQTCLASFGREEECAETVVRKLMEVLQAADSEDSVLLRWLRDQLED